MVVQSTCTMLDRPRNERKVLQRFMQVLVVLGLAQYGTIGNLQYTVATILFVGSDVILKEGLFFEINKRWKKRKQLTHSLRFSRRRIWHRISQNERLWERHGHNSESRSIDVCIRSIRHFPSSLTSRSSSVPTAGFACVDYINMYHGWEGTVSVHSAEDVRACSKYRRKFMRFQRKVVMRRLNIACIFLLSNRTPLLRHKRTVER